MKSQFEVVSSRPLLYTTILNINEISEKLAQFSRSSHSKDMGLSIYHPAPVLCELELFGGL